MEPDTAGSAAASPAVKNPPLFEEAGKDGCAAARVIRCSSVIQSAGVYAGLGF
jgi:hypothetical protein